MDDLTILSRLNQVAGWEAGCGVLLGEEHWSLT